MELKSHPKMLWRNIPQWPPHWGGSYGQGDEFIFGEPYEAKIKEAILVDEQNPAAIRLIVEYRKLGTFRGNLILCDDAEFLRRLHEKIKSLGGLMVHQSGPNE